MGLGVAALVTNRKQDPAPAPAPPFDPTSAHEGASIDSGGKIVLGNDLGDVSQPAAITSDREIVTNDLVGGVFALQLSNNDQGINTRLDGGSVLLTGAALTSPVISAVTAADGNPNILLETSNDGEAAIVANSTGAGAGRAVLDLRKGTNRLQISAIPGFILFTLAGVLDVWQIDTTTFLTQFGPTLVAGNGATVQVSGTLTRRLIIQGQGAGAYNVDRDLDSDKQIINSAAATLNLPNMVGANNRSGFILRACVKNAGGITIQANAGQVILIGAAASSAGGTLSSVNVGAYVTLIWDSTNWVAESFTATWTPA